MHKRTLLPLGIILIFTSSFVAAAAHPGDAAPLPLEETGSPGTAVPAPNTPSFQETASLTVAPPTEMTTPPVLDPTATTAAPPVIAITGVEPKTVSHESGGPISIYGRGFYAGIAVRLVGYGLLDSAVLNGTAIKAVVPPGLPEKRYSFELILPDGGVYRSDTNVRIKSSLPKPTETAKPGPPLVYGRPELLIQSVQTEPETVHPGSLFDLRLTVVNRGDYTATNIRLSLASLDLAVPTSGSNLVVVDLLASTETYDIVLPLALSEEASAGYANLALNLDYSDYAGREHTSQQSVGIQVSDSVANRPLVLLSAYRTDPSPLTPGDIFSLQMEVSNVGESTAEQLLITLGGQDGQGLAPFAILDSGNVQFIENLPAGASREIQQRFMLEGTASSGVYNLPVTLAYEGPEGDRQSETLVLNLVANRQPQLQIDFYTPPEQARVGEPVELPIEVVNIGRNLVNVSTVEVSGPDLEMNVSSAFIGALDGGTSGTLDAVAVPQESGAQAVVVTVKYLDDFNQAQEITQTLTIQVEQPPTPEPAGEDQQGQEGQGGFWAGVVRFFRGLLGLGS